MKPINSKLSEQLVDFIDLTDEELEEITISELGQVQGAGCGSVAVAVAFAGSCSCGSCGSCGSCFGFSCGSCFGFSCGSCFGFSCGSCGSCFDGFFF